MKLTAPSLLLSEAIALVRRVSRNVERAFATSAALAVLTAPAEAEDAPLAALEVATPSAPMTLL